MSSHRVKWSSGTQPPGLILPPGATDCHHHIYDSRFPPDANASIRPGDATIADYRALQKRLGTTRHVLVQPSTYGFDNGLMLEALAVFGPSARAVAVVGPDIADHELAAMDAAGVRGIRFNMLTPGGVTAFEMVAPLAARVAALGWHIQFNISPAQMLVHQDILEALPCPLVFDHMGHFGAPDGMQHPAFHMMVKWLHQGRAWVKLTAPYNDTASGAPAYQDRAAVAMTLVREAPGQLVWGTDWPHPTEPDDRKPDDAQMLDMMAVWAPNDTIRKQILVENPARLYGFP